jgi:hypothetical protein
MTAEEMSSQIGAQIPAGQDSPMDLVQCGSRFGGTRVGIWEFGENIVGIATIFDNKAKNKDEENRIREAIRFLLHRLKWWEGIWCIPLHRQKLWRDKEYIADSVIATAQQYAPRIPRIAKTVYFDKNNPFIMGLEWACDASARGVDIRKRGEIPRIGTSA